MQNYQNAIHHLTQFGIAEIKSGYIPPTRNDLLSELRSHAAEVDAKFSGAQLESIVNLAERNLKNF